MNQWIGFLMLAAFSTALLFGVWVLRAAVRIRMAMPHEPHQDKNYIWCCDEHSRMAHEDWLDLERDLADEEDTQP